MCGVLRASIPGSHRHADWATIYSADAHALPHALDVSVAIPVQPPHANADTNTHIRAQSLADTRANLGPHAAALPCNNLEA